MVDITLLELHLDDASFSASAPFSGNGEQSSDETMADAAEGSESGGGPSKLLLAVLTLGAAGAISWWLRGGEVTDVDDEIEVPV